ncbi:MAG: hypothetical protein GTN97_04480 [Nitrosopumilaceae archaeon]|nr:hypothetical protein [Nitrosopumilaceae archaeon]
MVHQTFPPYEPTKVRRVINKGTKIVEEEYKKPNWVGPEFHDHETQKVALAGNVMTSLARGTSITRLSRINRKRPIEHKGLLISVRRGTSLMRI